MASAPARLSPAARRVCDSGDLVLSVASAWEIGIKYRIGKLPLPLNVRPWLDHQLRMANVELLPVQYRHAMRASELPSDHRDPFDRLIAAQALEEDLPCVSADPAIELLGAKRIW